MRIKIVTLLIFLLIFLGFLQFQMGKSDVKETISVLNIEVPVRVFYKGETVDNLTKNDFSLIVNGKERNIIGFNIIKKQLQVRESEFSGEEKKFPPRYFVFAVNITNFSPEIKDGVNEIVDKIMRDNDTMLVFINNKSILIKNFIDKTAEKNKIIDLIESESVLARKRMLLYFKQIESEINMTKFRLTLKQTAGSRGAVDLKEETRYISDFLRKYIIIWKDYKNKYLVPDVKTYLLFAKHLQKIPVEKWVINFYQQELFPKIVMKGEIMRLIQTLIYKWQASTNAETLTYSRLVSKQVSEIRKELNVSKGFPTDEITKIFTKVGATFHSIFIGTQIASFSKDMEYKRISTDLENNLRELTRKTGGELVTSKNLKIAVDKLVKKRDIFYVLTYSPGEGEKLEKLKIKIHKRKHKLYYDDNVRTEFTKKPSKGIIVDSNTEIKIENLEFKEKKLSFSINEFALRKTEKGSFGSIKVRIRINNLQDNPVFDKSNSFTTGNSETKITLDFKWINSGRYEIIIEAKDNLTGKIASDFIQTKVK